MYKIDFTNPINVHFIGIGGISMSGLAEVLINKSFRVSGSDLSSSSSTEKLSALGAIIFHGHNEKNINSEIDLIVYTAAIKEDNPEYIVGKSLGIPMIDRASLLGQVMLNYKYPICVSGTHGKTTTTSMLSHVFVNASKDPTISVGGLVDLIEGNIKIGNSDFFITEACEYCDSFLKFFPYVEIILNIDEDHIDYFKDINHIRESFKNYTKNVPDNGYIVINSNIPNYEEIIADLNCTVISFGDDEGISDYYPKNLVFNQNGCPSFDVYCKGRFILHLDLSVAGKHNMLNALATIATSSIFEIDASLIIAGLSMFEGADRRFQYKGSLKGVSIVDDYAHHPTEVSATIEAAKKMNYNNIWVVFQPHTYTRTKAFLKDFAKALSFAYGIIVTDIYSAREKDNKEIHAKDLVEELRLYNENSYYISSFDDIEIFILQNCVPNDLLITMGAGNIYIVGEDLLEG